MDSFTPTSDRGVSFIYNQFLSLLNTGLMKKDNQLARIEQFLGQLQAPESKDAVILLDSEMDSTGAADDMTNNFQNCKSCRNYDPSACGANGYNCSNYSGACGGSTNGELCFNEKADATNQTVGC